MLQFLPVSRQIFPVSLARHSLFYKCLHILLTVTPCNYLPFVHLDILKMQLQQPHRRQRSFKQRRTLFSIPLFLDYPFEKKSNNFLSGHTVSQNQHPYGTVPTRHTSAYCPHFLFLTSPFQRSPALPYHLLHSCSCQVEGTGGTAIVLVPSRNCRFCWVIVELDISSLWANLRLYCLVARHV